MHPFVKALQEHFTANQNPEKAEPMARYMKNHFPFLGIQTPERRQLLKDVIQIHNLPDPKDFQIIVREPVGFTRTRISGSRTRYDAKI